MIPTGVQVFVALEPVDMRYGFNRLSGLALERTGYDSRCGALFVFRGKRGGLLKILFFDGSGICLFCKRLDRGQFVFPEPQGEEAQHIEVDEGALETLLDGIEIAPTEKPKRGRRPRVH